MYKTIKYIYFHNNTSLPININRWVDWSNRLYETKIEPGEKIKLDSSVGEWHMDSMLNDPEEIKLWKNFCNEKGIKDRHIIGKFRSYPCASGNYSWMEYDEPFECIYSESETRDDEIRGLITFSVK